MTILDLIIANKRKEVVENEQFRSREQLQDLPFFERTCLDFKESILAHSGIIAEFKRKSPSKGLINGEVQVDDVTTGYEKAGVSAISVLTDTKYFGGTFNDLLIARNSVQIPLLRKDFIIDGYQLYEAKALGADIILLIAAALTKEHCFQLAKEAKKLGLNVFLEIHDSNELQHVNEFVDVVGINNRNLKTFEVDIENSIRLCHQLPSHLLKVAESGINDPAIIKKMKAEGFNGFLIGESFMRSDNPGAACESYIKEAGL